MGLSPSVNVGGKNVIALAVIHILFRQCCEHFINFRESLVRMCSFIFFKSYLFQPCDFLFLYSYGGKKHLPEKDCVSLSYVPSYSFCSDTLDSKKKC